MILKVSGMSCQHCAASVTKALSALSGAESVNVSLEAGMAEITGTVDAAAAKAVIEDLGFDVIE